MFVQENGVKKNWKLKSKSTNRFNVDMHLFSDRSEMTSEWGKNKKSVTGGAAKVVTDVHFIKMSYITRTVIPCSLQSIAIQQDTMLDKRYFHDNLYVDPLTSESANIKHF